MLWGLMIFLVNPSFIYQNCSRQFYDLLRIAAQCKALYDLLTFLLPPICATQGPARNGFWWRKWRDSWGHGPIEMSYIMTNAAHPLPDFAPSLEKCH